MPKVQYCINCGEPTDRCEEDSIFIEDTGPLCEACARSLVAKYYAEIRVHCTASDGHADNCIGFTANETFPRWCAWKNADGDCQNKEYFNKLSREILE